MRRPWAQGDDRQPGEQAWRASDDDQTLEAMEGMASVFTSSGLENVSQASAPKDFRQFPLDPISLGLILFIKQKQLLRSKSSRPGHVYP